MGHALRKLSNLVEEFINDILSLVPLEGDLIWVDNKNDDVMLNLGEANGINVQDVFVVMALNQDFMDPLNQSDLGDKFTRKGIIKIVEVQGRFSRAKILAGSDFVPGDLVIPKFWKAIASRKKERSSKTKIIWGAFKGLPSLSY